MMDEALLLPFFEHKEASRKRYLLLAVYVLIKIKNLKKIPSAHPLFRARYATGSFTEEPCFKLYKLKHLKKV